MAKVPLSFLPATDIGGGGFLPENWWEEINESANWQDGIFFALCAAYALVSAVALVPSFSLSLDYNYEIN